MSKNITMVELARLANVDVSTVSRALKDSPLVKKSTKDHVLNIAKKNNFIVNALASSLRQKSTQTISVMFPPVAGTGQSISDSFFLQMFGAITEAASQRGYHVIVSCRDEQTDNPEQLFLQSGRADGAIIIGQHGRENRLNALHETHKNIVVWGGRSAAALYPVIGSDNIAGGQQATRHLLDTGHQNIVFVGDVDLPEVAMRHEGYVKAHQILGHTVDPDLILQQYFSGENLTENLKTLLAKRSDVDALFCTSDVLAMAAMNSLKTIGLRVPTDISIVGYDGIGPAEYAVPPLTTVSQNISLGGKMLVDTLLRKIGGEDVGSQFTPTELVIRQSSRARRDPPSKSVSLFQVGKRK